MKFKKRGHIEKKVILVTSLLIVIVLSFLIFRLKIEKQEMITGYNIEKVGDKYNIEINLAEDDINDILEIKEKEGKYVINKIMGGGVKSAEVPEELVISSIEIEGADKPDFRFSIKDWEGDGITTQVLVVEELNVDKATITLAKKGEVARIKHCADLYVDSNICNDWVNTDIPFTDNGDTITFDVEHFTGYGGSGYNVNLTIWDDTNDNESENRPHFFGEDIYFYAKYVNATNHTRFINDTNVNCSIYYNYSGGAWHNHSNMTYNDTSALFQFNLSFDEATGAANLSYKINCSAEFSELNNEADNMTAIDKFTVYDPGDPPTGGPNYFITVPANSVNWVATGIILRLNDYIDITAAGTISYSGPAWISAPQTCRGWGYPYERTECKDEPSICWSAEYGYFPSLSGNRTALVALIEDNGTLDSCTGFNILAHKSARINASASSGLMPGRLWFMVNDDYESDNSGAYYVQIIYNARTEQTITDCINITQSGDYTLTQDLIDKDVDCCVNIYANDVNLYCDNYVVDGNDIANGGICVDRKTQTNSSAEIRDCVVTDWDEYGIWIRRAWNNTIDNVSVFNNQDDGILITRDFGSYSSGYFANNNMINRSSVHNNSVGTGTDSGIHVIQGSYTTIINTTVFGHDSRGIDLYYSQGTNITDNNITNNTNGIWASVVDDLNVLWNNITENQERAITVAGDTGVPSAGGIIWKNTIIGDGVASTDYGIYGSIVMGWNISKNTIENVSYGIYLSNTFNSNHTIMENEINVSPPVEGATGIYLGWYAGNNSIINNTINYFKTGITIVDSPPSGMPFNNSIINNTIYNSSEYGMNIGGNTTTIKNNSITKSKIGVLLDDAFNTIFYNNTINGSTMWGLIIRDVVYNNEYFYNNFTKNTKDIAYDIGDENVVYYWNQLADYNYLSNGRLFVYNRSISNEVIDLYYENIGLYGCYDCNNIEIKNARGINNSHGVILVKSDNSIINNASFYDLITPKYASNPWGNPLDYEERGIYLYNTDNSLITNSNGSAFQAVRIQSSRYNNVTNSNFSTTYMGDGASMYGIYAKNSSNTIIFNNSFHGGSDLRAVYFYRTGNSTIDSNNISFNASDNSYGVQLAGGAGTCSNTTISNSIIEGPLYGIYSANSGYDIKILNNTINVSYTPVTKAIHITIGHNSTISLNNITNSYLYLQSSDYVNITDNHFTEKGAFIYTTSSDLLKIDNNIMANMTKGSFNGIRAVGNYNFIRNNTMYNLTGIGTSYYLIYSDGSYGEIINNILSWTPNGILLEGTDNNISKNKIFNMSNRLIYLQSPGGNNTFEDNALNDSGASSAFLIYLNADSNFSHNSIRGANVSFTHNLSGGVTLTITGVDNPAEDPVGYDNISKYLGITNSSAGPWVFLNVYYEDSDIPAGRSEDSLALRRYTGSMWTKDRVLQSGVDTVNNIVFGNLTHFSDVGVFAGENANLSIYYSGLLIADCTEDLTFYANYTNLTTGVHIDGAQCNITFDDDTGSVYDMIENGTINYYYIRVADWAGAGTYYYTINCSKTDVDFISVDNNISFSTCGGGEGGEIPEFNIIGIILILAIAIIGYVIISRKK